MTLLEKTVLNDTFIKLTFEYAGPCRVSVSATPREGVEMVLPDSDVFHASFLHGEGSGLGTFDIIVSSAQGVDMPLLDMTITGHYYSQEVGKRKESSNSLIILNYLGSGWISV